VRKRRFLGHARDLAIEQGDLLALMSAGAYGMSMSSNYNTRPRAAEIMVDGATTNLIREREKWSNYLPAKNFICSFLLNNANSYCAMFLIAHRMRPPGDLIGNTGVW